MKKLFIKGIFLATGLLLIIPVVSKSQWYNADKINKKAAYLFQIAYEEVSEGKYAESVGHLSDALKAEPKYVDANLARAEVYAKMKNYTAAITDYETAFLQDSVYAKSSLLQYAASLAGNGNFEKALAAADKFLLNTTLNPQTVQAATVKRNAYAFSIKYARDHPVNGYVFSPQNMGDSINSGNLEYLPSITVDGTKLIFNKRINGDEDFYESNRVNNVWSKAKPVTGRINTNLNEGAQNISQDGMWLVFTGCNYPEGEGSCDLYISYKNKNGEWGEAENLGRIINTEAWESAPSLSPDKRDLYFSSTRPGGFGGSDIWVTHRNEKGQWSKPENLGPEVNSTGDEGCPFIHADNQTLYFNSSGHPGYGMSDLFLIRKNENGKWGTAENLGYPLNSIDDEGSLIVAADGKTAYYASDKGNYKNGLDIYSFDLKENLRALKTLWVKGKITDKKTNAGLPASVELISVDSGYLLSKLQTDEDGNYLTTLPSGKSYAFTVNRKGYLFYSENFKLTGEIADSPMVINIALQPIETGASIVLNNIFFASKKFDLEKISFAELDKVALLMNENPKLSILISGYTDNVGKPADNLTLSVNRAKAVIAYLQSKGIDVKRLSGKGFGESKPVEQNTSEAGRAKNRRTTLTVISN